MSKVEILKNQDDSFVAHYIYCPACKCGHGFDKRWSFNGDFDKPTFTPSMLVKSKHPKGYSNDNPAPLGWHGEYENTVCHSFVTDGKIQYLSDCTHDMAGQTIDIPDLNENTTL
jgi:hypothetical protein